MALMNAPLLTIVIPTYNRSQFLNSNLLSIFKQIEDSHLVEVVVSDNHSSDNTPEVINNYVQYSNFRYYRQDENVGMSKNILDVVAKARGEFCWIVGDDDFIVQGAIQEIVRLIQTNSDIDFYYVSQSGISLSEYQKHGNLFDTTCVPPIATPSKFKILDRWEELISPKYSIVFLGELMASIFRREIWNTYELSIDEGYFSSLENTYPHCVIYANTFFGKKAIHISTPMILALYGAREWWDRVGYVLIVRVKEMLELYRVKGLKDPILKNCYTEYIRSTLPYSFKYLFSKSKYRDEVPLKKYFKFLFTHPTSTITALLIILKSGVWQTSARFISYLSPSLHVRLKNVLRS